jgi:hypothetical protein
MRGPTSSTRSNSSALACTIASIDPNSCASSSAVRSPTKRMLKPHQHPRQPGVLRFSYLVEQLLDLHRPEDALLLFRHPAPLPAHASCSSVSIQIGDTLHRTAFQERATDASPKPSMFITPRLPQCSSVPRSRAGQSTFTQR